MDGYREQLATDVVESHSATQALPRRANAKLPNVAQSTSDTIIRFDEGLIGLADCKYFALSTINNARPFRLLECAGSRQISFVVLDPTVRVKDYCQQIPEREWETIGAAEPSKRAAYVIVNLGLNANDSTANFQAPLLINLDKMIGRQVILTDSGFCMRTPLVG